MPPRSHKTTIAVRAGMARKASASLTEAVVNDMVAALERRGAAAGALVPSERKLAELYGVSRVTTRNALKRLVSMGLLERKAGVGYRFTGHTGAPAAGLTVGLVYSDLTRMRGSISIAALESRLAHEHGSLTIAASGRVSDREDRCILRMRRAGIGALIIAPATRGGTSPELARWITDGLPAVLEGHPGGWCLPRAVSDRSSWIDSENEEGMRSVLDYLWSLGHRAYAFCHGGDTAPVESYGAFTGWVRARECLSRPAWHIGGVGDGDGAGRLRRIFRAGARRPTAVVCASDDTAVAVIDQLDRLGLACPEDVSVTGFYDESVQGPGTIGKLTTVGYSRQEYADEVVAMLSAQARRDAAGSRPQQKRLPMTLLVRQSCAPPKVTHT
jgi:DNA-binding LacI/PurR family transcriptional regulator